jgi:tyrosine-protein kinase Etk/Wzc
MPSDTRLDNRNAPDHEDDDGLDLFAILATLLDHKWLILIVTAVFAAGGYLLGEWTLPIYRANAVIQVESKGGNILADLEGLGSSKPSLGTEIELMKSRAVIGKAVDNLSLDIQVSPLRYPLIGDVLARRFQPTPAQALAEPVLGDGRHAWGGEQIEVRRFEVPEARRGELFTLVAGEAGTLRLLDAAERTLLEGRVGVLLEGAGIALQVDRLLARPGTRFNLVRHNRLGTILNYQAAVQVTTQRDTQILNLALSGPVPGQLVKTLDEISRQFVLQNTNRMAAQADTSLAFLREQLPQVRAQVEKAERALNNYKRSTRTIDIGAETGDVLQKSVALETQLTELNFQLAEAARKYTTRHPTYQEIQRKIDELKRRQRELGGEIQRLPDAQQDVFGLTRDLQVSTEIYNQFLNKSQELSVMRAGTIGSVRIIDTAVVSPQHPVEPNKSRTRLVATLLGFVLACALVLVRRMMNRALEAAEAIEQIGLPVLATVPLSVFQGEIDQRIARRRGRSASVSQNLLALEKPGDLAIEALRSLRTSLHFAMLDARNKCVMISGPSPAVGKSFISVNLATVIAQSGQRVLLVDCDLRKGHLHRYFGQPSSPGLSDFLIKDVTFQEVVRSTPVAGLSVVTRGHVPPNPSELLMHPNFSAFLEQAASQFDLLLFDTPPLLAVTDAAIVGRQMGTSLIVARAGMNLAREVELTVHRFAQSGIDIKGAIFNGIERRASAYGRYGKYYGYGYYHYEYKSEK